MRVIHSLVAFEFADDFFEDIFQGDDAQHFAVFVHHHAQAPLLFMEVQQLQLQRRAFRHEVGFVAGGEQGFFGQAGVGQQVLDLASVEHRLDLVDVAVKHRQARALGRAQLLDDGFDRVIQVDAIHFTARHQDVVDRDVVQGVDAGQAGGAVVVGLGLRFVVMLGQRFVAFLYHAGFTCKRAQQQQADAVEQPGQRREDFQRHAQQRVAKAQDGVGVTDGEGAGQVVGEHQQHRAGDQPAEPRAVLRPGINRQQRAQNHHGRAAQAVTQDQAVTREVQAGGGLVALACAGAYGQQVLLCSFNGGKQRRP